MFHRIGVLLVVTTYMSITSASPTCTCTREMKPVCGTDGQTYSNLCELECQQQSDPELDVRSNGYCRNVREAGNDEADVDCLCTLEYDPVCGSDGRTYSNRCDARCFGSSSDVKILHEGECSEARRKREACLICPAIWAPVCGTNGKTYANSCTLDCSGQDVKVAYEGDCKEARKKREACLVCPAIYAPVCGTNGKTYANSCTLDCSGQDVKVAYQGGCRNKREHKIVVREVSSEECTCERNYDPVCANNGETYGNQCLMMCGHTDLTVEYFGPCVSN